MPKTITVIDTFGFFFRSFYALPPLTNKEGFPTGLLTGFVNFVSNLHKEHSSDYIIFALDTKGPSFRNEIDPNYKANREAPPEALTQQLPLADVFLIASGTNERQVAAIAEGIEDALFDQGAKAIRREGMREGRWALMDFLDVIVHVMHQEDRAYYELERLWKDCPVVPLPDAE